MKENIDIDTLSLLNSYKSKETQWEKFAAVRSKARRMLDQSVDGYFYPLPRQPIIVHPYVEKLGETAKQFILIQSMYKYLNDIANIEKDVINKVAYKITKNEYFIDFTRDIRHDALSIIIDESYHAYVALDFINQVEQYTNIKPLPLPQVTELSLAIEQISNLLETELRNHFEFISVCIAEHALTNDLIVIAKEKQVHPSFYYVMHDHALDEGRHAKYFSDMLRIYWGAMKESDKNMLGPLLVELLRRYISLDLQKHFDESILSFLGVEEEIISKIIQETHIEVSIGEQKDSNIVLKQMIALLKNTGVLDHAETQKNFVEYNLL